MGKERQQSVHHYCDGRAAWNVGWGGFAIRASGIASSGTLVTVLTMGPPLWWREEWSRVNVSLPTILLVTSAVLTLFVVGGLTYLRKRTIRSLEMKYYLHRLAHDIRERQIELSNDIARGEKLTEERRARELELFLSEITENVVSHFKTMTGKDVSAAIRILAQNDSGEFVYRTRARSKNMNNQRGLASEDIPAIQGIPRFLREEKGAHGILVYNDLDAAADMGAYQITANDRRFKDEVKTMMVAPLNVSEAGKKTMLGLLFVNCREPKVFGLKHVDSMGYAADLIAPAIMNMIILIRQCGSSDEENKNGQGKGASYDEVA